MVGAVLQGSPLSLSLSLSSVPKKSFIGRRRKTCVRAMEREESPLWHNAEEEEEEKDRPLEEEEEKIDDAP